MKNIIAVDLFSGAGGTTSGLKKAGIKVAAAIEIDKWAAQTYRHNNPEVVLFEADIRNISGKKIIDQVSLSVQAGKTAVLLGPNGAGKSTLGAAIMGDFKFQVTSGTMTFNQQKIQLLHKPTESNERSLLGLFMTMQNPVEIPGVTTTDLLRNALIARGKRLTLDEVRSEISAACKKLNTNIFFSERELNVGFSGGEKKRNEILQLLVLKPKLAILDEIDSGLDIDAANNISTQLNLIQKSTGMSFLIITHNMKILKKLKVDKVYIMARGQIALHGGASLIKKVEQTGFSFLKEKLS